MIISHSQLGIIIVDQQQIREINIMKDYCQKFTSEYSNNNLLSKVICLPMFLLSQFFLLLDEMFAFSEEDEIIEALIF